MADDLTSQHAGPTPDAASIDAPGPPHRIGRYTVVRLLGSGGMGDVYEALQDQPRRTVALKVMRPGIASSSALRRFEYESQILARLQHPCIAQVFEAGAHRDPRYPDPIPYFVMEYIAVATPITEYAADRKLSQADCLALMSRVCDAVAHGHAKGIIHRDLKPSNILVDAAGNPKVIDFGVARGTDSDMATIQTGAGQIIGTLQYMSPEQCSDDPRTLDHRSDVYSLGVILYELLCGRLPYDVSRRSLSEATRIIRENPLTPPSACRREVRGDVETVILRAVARERDRRYQSVLELKQDIDRCLAGEPIAARRDSSLYVVASRVRGAAARNRPLAMLIAVVLATLVAQLVFAPALAHWKAPSRAFERLCDRLTASPVTTFDKVRLIALTDSTDIAALARSESLEGVDPGNTKSFRRLHGRLLQRLAAAEPGVVMFDIKFREATPFDEDMAAGARALSAAGADTIVACPGWEVDADGAPRLSPTLAGAVRWGSSASSVGKTQLWRLQLALQPRVGETMMSMTLRTLASLKFPGLEHTAQIDDSLLSLRVQAFRVNPKLPGVRAPKDDPIIIPVTAHPTVADEPGFGIHRDDLIATYQVDPPPTAVFESATWDYSKVFTESPESLRSWCSHKAVIVYDGRGDIDRHDHPDGRHLPGSYAHAIGLEQLLRSSAIRLPSNGATWALTALCAAAAIPLASRRRLHALLPVLLTALVFLALSILAYRWWQYLINPIIPSLALALCAGIVVSLPRPRISPQTTRSLS